MQVADSGLAAETLGSGPLLIVLHDLFASAASWRGVARALAASHRVICVDLRNHGRSPRAVSMAHTEMADDVLCLIEREGLDRPTVVGHGLGGKVAMTLALTAPYAVGRLAVLDVAPDTDAQPWARQMQAMREVLTHGRIAATGGAEPAMPRLATRNAYTDWRSNLAAIARAIPALSGFPRHLRYLGSDVPLHAILGARSDWVQPASAEAFAPMFPLATVEQITDAGHWIHADQRDALVASLRRMLDAPTREACRMAAPTRHSQETTT